MTKSSSGRKKTKRSSATRLDSSFARPRLRAKAFFLAVGIMGGALVAATVKSFILSEKHDIETTESTEDGRLQLNSARTAPVKSNRVATTTKTTSKPKLTLTAEPVIEREDEKAEEPKSLAKLEPVKIKAKEKSYMAAPKRKAIAVVAAQPFPAAIHSAPSPAPSLASNPIPSPLAQPRPRAVPAETSAPVKTLVVKKSEEHPLLVEAPILTLSEETRSEPTTAPREKIRKVEVQEKIIKEAPKVANHIVKDDNFRSRLKKVKKVEVVEAEAEELDTAVSPFQDRLRKSVK